MEQFLKEYRPQRPWASNDLKASGVKREKRAEALSMKFIEPNVRAMRNLLIVDIDADDAAWGLKSKVFDDKLLPIPSFISTNPATSHAHAGWFIDGVASTDKQIYVFEQMRKKMAIAAGGDPFYTGSIFRNPLSSWAQTEYFAEASLYTFDELSNYTKGIKLSKPSEALITDAEGRNVTLFEKGRQWAYSAYYNALKYNSLPYFRSSLEDYLLAENAIFDKPLSKSEAISIARSIESFVSKKFNLEQFEKKQAKQRERSIVVRQEKAQAKYRAIKAITDEGHSLKLACDTLGFNYNSVRASWAKWEGKK